MKAKLVALNLVLIAAIGVVVWEARARIGETERQRRALPVPHPAHVQPTPVPKPDTPPATKYEDVAKKNLFAADRNDDIIVDPPKAEAVKPMPPLPVVYGVMTLPSGTKASMAEKSGETTRMVKPGDSVGEFKITALDAKNVTFDWNGKEISKKIEDLIDRSNQQVAATGPVAAAPPPPAAAAAAPKNPTDANLGKELTPTTRACQPGDGSAIGAVVGGYRKQGQQTPFGTIGCQWVKQ